MRSFWNLGRPLPSHQTLKAPRGALADRLRLFTLLRLPALPIPRLMDHPPPSAAVPLRLCPMSRYVISLLLSLLSVILIFFYIQRSWASVMLLPVSTPRCNRHLRPSVFVLTKMSSRHARSIGQLC